MSEEFKKDLQEMLSLQRKLRNRLNDESINYKHFAVAKWALVEVKIQLEKIIELDNNVK